MPYARPTLSGLRAQVAADIAASLPGADALLRYSNLGILGDVEAALANGLYGFVDWLAGQAVPFTASGEYLEGWAALKGVTRAPATAAGGAATFTGASGLIPAGTGVVRGDGVGYVTTADASVVAGTVTVALIAQAPGAAGNAAAATVMTLGSAIAGIGSTGAASGPITGGADLEADASLRSRMLQAYAAPPQGGDAGDYVGWALQVPGVTRAWWGGQNASAGGGAAGTVVVYFMMDGAEAAHGGFPQGANGVATLEARDSGKATGDQLAVANWIYPLRPVTALVYVFAPSPNPVAMTIAGIASASTATQTAIAAAIDGVYLQYSSPGGVVDISYVEAAIASVAGTAGFVLTATSCPHGTVSPTNGNIAANAGYLSVRGTLTYA